MSLVFFHTVRAVAYWHKIYVKSTPVHAYLTGVSQGGRVQTIAGLATNYAPVTSKLQLSPPPPPNRMYREHLTRSLDWFLI